MFTRPSADGQFTEQSKLHANDPADNDYLGESVSLYGNTALIGAHGVDHDNKENSGSVYVFTRPSSDGTFTQQSKFHASDPAAEDHFGISVSLYGDTALIGASYDDFDDGNSIKSNSGSVYVFTRSSVDGTFERNENNLNSTRGAMLELLIFSVIPFLYTVTRR